MTLDQLKPGQRGVVRAVNAPAAVAQRLFEMGLLEGEIVEVVTVAPLGDPMDVRIQGFQLSVRKADAVGIVVDLDPAPTQHGSAAGPSQSPSTQSHE
jgi:ferrous iron transport protein A